MENGAIRLCPLFPVFLILPLESHLDPHAWGFVSWTCVRIEGTWDCLWEGTGVLVIFVLVLWTSADQEAQEGCGGISCRGNRFRIRNGTCVSSTWIWTKEADRLSPPTFPAYSIFQPCLLEYMGSPFLEQSTTTTEDCANKRTAEAALVVKKHFIIN